MDTPSTPSRPARRTFLSAAIAASGAAVVAPVLAADPARAGGHHPTRSTPPPTAQAPGRELVALLRRVDRRRIQATVETLAAFGTRHTLSSQTDPHRGIGAARDWLLAQYREIAADSGGRMSVELQSYVQQPASRIPVATRISNVVATLHGTSDPRRTYVVSGHYDSRATDVMDFTSDAPGADDDASGVAVALELARVMARQRFAATVVFAAVAGEEQGLYGATHLAAQLRAAGADVQAMFTNDIVGSPRADGVSADPTVVRLFAEGVPSTETPEQAAVRESVGGENDSPARQLARFVSEVADNGATGMDVRVVYRRDRYLRGGDHLPFLAQGWPAARFTEPREDYRHQHQDVRVQDGVRYGDLPRFCDFGYIAGVARVNGAVLWSLATAPGTPTGARLLTDRLTNETDLVWDGGGAGARGYEVVYRETTAAQWQHAVRVGDVTKVTLDISKDNVFFGVRALDRSGRHSPAAFPVPG